MRAKTGETFVLELDPPRIRCRRCGFRTRLRFGDKVDGHNGVDTDEYPQVEKREETF